jgi:hypothetical protein
VQGTERAAILIYDFTIIQQVNQLISVYIVYGLFLKHKEERKSINYLIPIIILCIAVIILPKIALLLILLLRGIILRFNIKGEVQNKVLLTTTIASISILFYKVSFSGLGLEIFSLSAISSLLVIILFGQTYVSIPKRVSYSFDSYKKTIAKAGGDYGLLIAPMMITFYTRNKMPDLDYINFQMGLTALGFMALISSLIERLTFENKLFNLPNNKHSQNYYFIICSLIVTLSLSIFLKLPGKLIIPLLINSILGPLFAFYWNELRFINSTKLQLQIGIAIIIMTGVWIILNMLLFNNSSVSALIFIAIATMIKIIWLKNKISANAIR